LHKPQILETHSDTTLLAVIHLYFMWYNFIRQVITLFNEDKKSKSGWLGGEWFGGLWRISWREKIRAI